MILTNEQVAILTNEQPYEGSLVKQEWSYSFLKDTMSPLGNILVFECPTTIGGVTLLKSLVIAVELPNVNMFGGVSFMRLYCTHLGSLLSQIMNKDCYVDESYIIVENNQTSISLINYVKESTLFNIIFSSESQENVFGLNLTPEEKMLFQEKAIDCFDHLTKSIFIETRRDNF